MTHTRIVIFRLLLTATVIGLAAPAPAQVLQQAPRQGSQILAQAARRPRAPEPRRSRRQRKPRRSLLPSPRRRQPRLSPPEAATARLKAGKSSRAWAPPRSARIVCAPSSQVSMRVTAPRSAHDPEAMTRAIRALLANQLVLSEAVASRWDQQPAVARQLQQLRDNAVVQTYLQSKSMPPQDFPGEADLQAAYDANKSSFLIPRQYLVAQIFIAVPKDADKAAQDKAKARIDEVAQKLKQPGADSPPSPNQPATPSRARTRAARSAGSRKRSSVPTSRHR